jgi:membrane protein implicated in regulation of membrane protease activity
MTVGEIIDLVMSLFVGGADGASFWISVVPSIVKFAIVSFGVWGLLFILSCFVLFVYLGLKAVSQEVKTGDKRLFGLEAEVVVDFNDVTNKKQFAEGIVRVGGEIWKARIEYCEELPKKTNRVIVVGADGLVLKISKLS